MRDFSHLDSLEDAVNSGVVRAHEDYSSELDRLLKEDPEETLLYLTEVVMRNSSRRASEIDKIVADLIFDLASSFTSRHKYIRLIAKIISRKSLFATNKGFNLGARLAFSDGVRSAKFIDFVKDTVSSFDEQAEDYQALLYELMDSVTELAENSNNMAAIMAANCPQETLINYINFISGFIKLNEEASNAGPKSFLIALNGEMRRRINLSTAVLGEASLNFVDLLILKYGFDSLFLFKLIRSGLLDDESLRKLHPYKDRIFSQFFNNEVMRARALLLFSLKTGTPLNRYFKLDTKEKCVKFLNLFYEKLAEKFRLNENPLENSSYLHMLMQSFSDDLSITPIVKLKFLSNQNHEGHLGICFLKSGDYFNVDQFVELLISLKSTALVTDAEIHALLSLEDPSGKSFVEYLPCIDSSQRFEIIMLLIRNHLLSDEEARKLEPQVEALLHIMIFKERASGASDEKLIVGEVQMVLSFFQESINPECPVGLFFSLSELMQSKLTETIINFVVSLSKKIDLTTLNLCLGLLQSRFFLENPIRLGKLFDVLGYKLAVAVANSANADFMDRYLRLLELFRLADTGRCLAALTHEFKAPDGSLTSFVTMVLQKYPAQPQLWLRIINTGASVYYTFTDFLIHKDAIADELIRQSRELSDEQAIALLSPACRKDNPLGRFIAFTENKSGICSLSIAVCTKIKVEINRREELRASLSMLSATVVDAAGTVGASTDPAPVSSAVQAIDADSVSTPSLASSGASIRTISTAGASSRSWTSFLSFKPASTASGSAACGAGSDLSADSKFSPR